MASQKVEFSLELLARGFTSCTLFDYSQYLIHRARAKASECNVAIKRTFSPSAWHEIGNDMVVCRRRKLDKNAIHAREMILSKAKGLIRDQNYAVRLYGPQALSALMEEAGFEKVDVRTGFSPHKCEDGYGFMNHRMLATGQKL